MIIKILNSSFLTSNFWYFKFGTINFEEVLGPSVKFVLITYHDKNTFIVQTLQEKTMEIHIADNRNINYYQKNVKINCFIRASSKWADFLLLKIS